MRAGQRGPRHHVDCEQVWTLLSGELRVEANGEVLIVRAGDTLRLPSDVPRQIDATADMRAVVASPAGPSVTTLEGVTRPLSWAA